MDTPPDQVTEVTYVARVVQPDGAVRWVQTRQVPLRDEAGNLRHIVGISTDITVQKRREAEFETLNRIVRHDIRNDTSVILGWAELLGDHVDEEGTAHLEKIVSAGEQIVELTDVAGTYAVAVAGRESMVVTPVSLRPTLTDEILIRSETYPAAEISLVGEIPDVEVLAKELLQSVFRNLLNNAIQHNDKATPRVTLSCSTTEETVTVEVADNGPGIPEESKESVFGKGVSGLASSGSGVGLSLVRGLVDQYNGVFPSGTTIRRARCSR